MECHYCGMRLDRRTATRDHVVPLSRGGQDVAWNIVWSCRQCNEDKGHDWPSCECGFCQEAIRRHPNAWRGTRMAERPRTVRAGREGPRCRNCGEITATPQDCPWCRYAALTAEALDA